VLAGALALAPAGPAVAVEPAPTRLVIAQQREHSSLNPALEPGFSSTELGMLLFQYLVKFDDRGRLVGDAAREVPSLANGGISRDGRTVTYHLRPGLRFADGAPLTARDCAFSIAAILNPRNDVNARTGYDQIARTEVPNDATLVLHLRRPYAPLLVTVMAPNGYPIFPAHLLRRYADFNHIPFDSAPIGSGPYVVTRWERGDRLQMEANPYYAGGKPAIERLELRFVPNGDSLLNLLRTGEVDGAYNIPIALVPQARQLPGTRTVLAPVNGAVAVLFNTRDPLTADASVRHALAEAIDLSASVRKSYHGVVTPQAAPERVFQWAYDPRAYPPIPSAPDDARRRLDAAGWKPGPDGIRIKNGRRAEATFALLAGNTGNAVFANTIAAYELAIGVEVTVKPYAAAEFFAPGAQGGPIFGGAFTMALFPFYDGDDPDVSDQFTCASVPPRGLNKTRLCDADVDALLAAGVATFDPGRRKAIYVHLQQRLAALLPLFVVYNLVQPSVFPNRLMGATESVSSIWWNVGAWRLKAADDTR